MSRSGQDGKGEPRERRTRRNQTRAANVRNGRGQLSLVEHALCPLDTTISLNEGFIHEVEYLYTDESRHTRSARAKVGCLYGLSPSDEFYLWGLLALTFRQPEPSADFYATAHYILKELGCLGRDSGETAKGGENYRLFREALARLSAVTYQCKMFYDPIRGEHRDVAFGFLTYSLPTDPNSSRAWRIIWDLQFFEFCKAAGGYLLFDLDTYRELDFASRRLFLALKKVFYRSAMSPVYDVRHLCVNVLGFGAANEVRELKRKLARCAERLAVHQIIELPEAGVKGVFEKKAKGSYTVQFRRGAYFDKPQPTKGPALATESALYEPLKAIGFDDAAIVRIVRKHRPELIQTWADITLAAIERKKVVFKRSPQAYFMDNIEKAAQGRTPPDWWLEHRKEEDRREREANRNVLRQALPKAVQPEKDEDAAFEEYVRNEAREAVQSIVERLVRHLMGQGFSADQAAAMAAQEARKQLRSKFRQDHPEYEKKQAGPMSLGDILKNFGKPQ